MRKRSPTLTSRAALATCPLDKTLPNSQARFASGRVLKNRAAQSQMSIRTPVMNPFSYKHNATTQLEMKNQITRHRQLILPPPIVVGLHVPGAFEAQLRTDLDRRADPVTPRNCVLGVARRVTCPLPFLVVEII